MWFPNRGTKDSVALNSSSNLDFSGHTDRYGCPQRALFSLRCGLEPNVVPAAEAEMKEPLGKRRTIGKCGYAIHTGLSLKIRLTYPCQTNLSVCILS